MLCVFSMSIPDEIKAVIYSWFLILDASKELEDTVSSFLPDFGHQRLIALICSL